MTIVIARRKTTKSEGCFMSTHTTDNRTATVHRDLHPTTVETKPAFKTTELIVWAVSVLGVLIASAMVDGKADGQGFGADHAWMYVTILSVGYMVSRGLAKAGSYQQDNDPRS
jgi:hypothetical protein